MLPRMKWDPLKPDKLKINIRFLSHSLATFFKKKSIKTELDRLRRQTEREVGECAQKDEWGKLNNMRL